MANMLWEVEFGAAGVTRNQTPKRLQFHVATYVDNKIHPDQVGVARSIIVRPNLKFHPSTSDFTSLVGWFLGHSL